MAVTAEIMSLPPLLALAVASLLIHSLMPDTKAWAASLSAPSSKKVVTQTFTSLPLAAPVMTLESQVSPARIGMVMPLPAAWSIIRAAASVDTGEKNTSAPLFWAVVM